MLVFNWSSSREPGEACAFPQRGICGLKWVCVQTGFVMPQ